MTTQMRSASRPVGSSSTQARRNYLSEIRTDVGKRPIAAIWYGVPGIGKTSTAAAVPGVIFMHTVDENGITTLKNYGRISDKVPQLPPVRSWGEALDMLDWLATADHPHKCVALDAMGSFERLCHEEVCRRDYRGVWGDKGFGSYQKGYETSLTDWRLLINALDRVRDAKGMSVIWLSHSLVKTFKNPEGPDYDQYIPDVNSRTWQITHKWASMVLFLNSVAVVNDDGKAQTAQQRIMLTENHPAYAAKNQCGLPSMIEMGDSGAEAWGNLAAALKAAKGKDGGSDG